MITEAFLAVAILAAYDHELTSMEDFIASSEWYDLTDEEVATFMIRYADVYDDYLKALLVAEAEAEGV